MLKICVYQVLGNSAGDQLHAMFATLVPDFPSPYQGMGLTALAALTPDTTVREWLLSLCIVVDFFPFPLPPGWWAHQSSRNLPSDPTSERRAVEEPRDGSY